jgi:hypothetical protein
MNYENIPEEMRWDRSWCLAGPDDSGKYKAPHAAGPKGIFKIKPTNNLHWKDFETVREQAEQHAPCGIGFILAKTDCYTCIDLDIKNGHNYPDKIDSNGKPIEWTSEEDIARFLKIISHFDSYTERSASGQGYHIWIRGAIPGGIGIKRDGVEVYSQERFIVCTGDVFLDRPIEKRQELLELLIGEIKNGSEDDHKFELAEVEETESDQAIFDRAIAADNADKFISLCEGNFESYPSQSEADLALISIFAFYTKSNVQCRRLFRMTKLGERIKANKNDVHIDRILRIIRGRQDIEAQSDVYAQAQAAVLLANLRGNTPAPVLAPPVSAAVPLAAPVLPAPPPAPLPAALADPLAIPFPEELPKDEGTTYVSDEEDDESPTGGIDWPPGMVGALAKFIYNGSPRPVREVSIVAALGLMAGICGKAYIIPQSGLNLYIVLVARSAVGKEAMHSGIANVLNFVRDAVPNAMTFVDFSDYASGPGLTKAVAANPSFVNVSGEWGRKLKRLAVEDGRDGPMQQLRTVMTNLYQKSGPASIVGGIGYSDKEKNVASVSGAAYSMIGETTPGTFYDSLTENMMEDGFLSRFTVVEYTGERPDNNYNVVKNPEPRLLEAVCALMTQAIDLNNRFVNQEVERDAEAAQMLMTYDKQCDNEIRSAGDDESRRQPWNRAHLKVCRIAALLAVGDNHICPVMTKEHVTWALDLVTRDINLMRRRMSSGDVGIGDAPRERKVLSIIEKYLTAPVAPSYKVNEKMRVDGIVPRSYLQICTQRAQSFTGHRNGQNAVLDSTIKSLMDSGYLQELSKEKAIKGYEFHGRCFRVITLPMNSQEKKSFTSRRK